MPFISSCKSGLLGLALLPFLAAPCLAAPHVADFSLAMPRSEAEKRGLTQCGQDLCGEVNFGGALWNGVFRLDSDAKGEVLGAISLRGALSDAFMDAAFAGIEQSPYILIYAGSENGAFNFSRLAREGKSEAEMDAEFKHFVDDVLRSGNSAATYVFALPETYAELKKTDSADLPKTVPQGKICTLHISAQGVTVLIGTVAYLADHMPAALPILGESPKTAPEIEMEPEQSPPA